MKFFHTALSVNSFEESQKFYETVFGFHVRAKGERPELGSKFIVLDDTSGAVIELFEHKLPKKLNDDLMDFQQVGLKHIAFIVDNIDEIMSKALKNGAKVIWPIKKGITVKRIAFIADPNGIPIELVEV